MFIHINLHIKLHIFIHIFIHINLHIFIYIKKQKESLSFCFKVYFSDFSGFLILGILISGLTDGILLSIALTVTVEVISTIAP